MVLAIQGIWDFQGLGEGAPSGVLRWDSADSRTVLGFRARPKDDLSLRICQHTRLHTRTITAPPGCVYGDNLGREGDWSHFIHTVVCKFEIIRNHDGLLELMQAGGHFARNFP